MSKNERPRGSGSDGWSDDLAAACGVDFNRPPKATVLPQRQKEVGPFEWGPDHDASIPPRRLTEGQVKEILDHVFPQ